MTDELPDLYGRARHDAEGLLREHGEQEAADALPHILEQITGDWLA